MNISKLIVIVGLILLFQTNVFTQKWSNKFIPLQTTIEEIEQILVSKPFNAKVLRESPRGDLRIYYLKDGALSIFYSLGRCVVGTFGKLELEKNIIIQASFHPTKWRKITYYEKDIKSLKIDTSAASQYITYENVKKGITYTIQLGKVSDISFIGPENLDIVRCKD